MCSAFHYNANRGDKRFRQMYKSGEKRPDWNRELEDSIISRARNNRHLLVEKFRQIQSQLTEESEDQNSTKSQDDSQDAFTSKDTFLSSNKDSLNFKDIGFPSSSSNRSFSNSRPIAATGQSTSRNKPRGSVSAFDSNSCEGFDYSGSFKNKLNDDFTFNMENYNSTEDIFDKNFSVDNTARERLRKNVWNNNTNDYDYKLDDNSSLLCPGCKLDYMLLKDSSLLCSNCTLQIDLSSPTISIKMIKEKLKQKLDQHKLNCKEKIKYKFKDEKLFIGCKSCKKEFYIE